FFLLALASGARAYAQEPDVFAQHHVTIAGVVGIGTPVGEVGAELTVAPLPWVELSGAMGTNLFGPQVAFTGRLRVPLYRRWAVTMGGGWSEGAYGHDPILGCITGPPCAPDWHGTIQWANVEGGFEFQHQRGFTVRIFGGMGYPLNPDGL